MESYDEANPDITVKLNVTCAKLLQSCPTLCDSTDCSLQASLSMGFSRQDSWSGVPFPSPGIFLTQGSDPRLLCLLPLQEGSLQLALPEKLNRSHQITHI